MTKQLYPIGHVARRTGLSVSAIRCRADEGVVPPTSHTDGAYRHYDVEAVARLELVRTLRDLGASVEDVRRVPAEELTLHDLASTHPGIVERQLRHPGARRAVLRTVVSQGGSARQVALAQELVSLSDEDRERLLDEFWDEVTEGLAVHPAFAAHLHRLLPDEPATEQSQAWIELADMVRDEDFRGEVRRFFHGAFAAPEARAVTSPEVMARVERHRLVEVEAWEAERSGVEPGSERGRESAGRLLALLAEAHRGGDRVRAGGDRAAAGADRTRSGGRRARAAGRRGVRGRAGPVRGAGGDDQRHAGRGRRWGERAVGGRRDGALQWRVAGRRRCDPRSAYPAGGVPHRTD
ncbi:MerR family transcriptional regulator [Lentzea sp. CC55]|uniref:MerR family transcriptional regulator n=1 Tax=Lentzea sp. CC55 TaxID=2884909 RepID=UPI001F2680DA|nr:MerR family transcriptional regulator [Lentzea sp. CC55]MCG8926697.1 MerR family transcriptional regulator [Lentzea sp. CC55]